MLLPFTQNCSSSPLLPRNIKIKYTQNYNETWSVILTEEHRLSLPDSRVMRDIFQLKVEEGAEDWMKLLIDEPVFIAILPW